MSEDKIKVETTGDFMMQEPATLEVIEAYGTSEVTLTEWVKRQIANGKLKSHDKIRDLPAPDTGDEPVKAKAPKEGDTRGASKSKDPRDIQSVKN